MFHCVCVHVCEHEREKKREDGGGCLLSVVSSLCARLHKPSFSLQDGHTIAPTHSQTERGLLFSERRMEAEDLLYFSSPNTELLCEPPLKTRGTLSVHSRLLGVLLPSDTVREQMLP